MTGHPTGPPAPRRRRGQGKGPRPLQDSLRQAMGRLGGDAEPGAVAMLFARWEEIAGPGMAEHVRPVRLAKGALVVAADQPAWATKARLSGTHLLDRVGQLSGQRPDRLDVVVRAP